MSQAVIISEKTIEEIFARLDSLAKELKAIKTKLFEKEPLYGSDEWWEWSERKADEDMGKNRLVRFDSINDAVKWLNS